MLINPEEARLAIVKGQFVPYFQPLVTLRSGQLKGFEILARWNHPKLGVVLPGQFIYAAEIDGWITPLMQELLRSAFQCAPMLPESLTLSINVSPVQLKDLALPRQIRDTATHADFPLTRLVVEITESALTDNLDHAQTITRELKSFGCRIALDDFGTGYSSLLHLQSLPFDDLKVDRSFVTAMTSQRECRKIVAAVVGLGQSLSLTTVAEGIETKEQAEMLLWMGCEVGQGWLFGKPIPASQIEAAVNAPRQRLSTGISSQLISVAASNVDTLPAQRLAQLQAVYDGAPVGLAFLDRNLRHVNINQRLADMNGIPVADHLGKTLAELLPHLSAQIEPYLQIALQGEIIPGIQIRKWDSITQGERTLRVSCQPAFDEVHDVVGVSVCVLDETDRQSADDALIAGRLRDAVLLKTEAQLKAVVSAVPVGLILTDTIDGSPNLANSEALRILHEPPAYGSSLKNDSTWISANASGQLADTAEPPLANALVHGKTTMPADVLFHRSDGTETWVNLSGAPILGPDDEIVGGLVVLQDIDAVTLERQRLISLAGALVKELET